MAKDNLTVKLEDTDPIFKDDKKGASRVSQFKLEDIDPIFKDTLPAPTETISPVINAPPATANLKNLPEAYQIARKAFIGEAPQIPPGVGEFIGGTLGATAGGLEQGRNILNLRPSVRAIGETITAPPSTKPTGSGAAWLRNWAGMDRPITGGVPEGAQTYQRAKTHGEAGSKMFQRYGTQPLDIARYTEAADEADRARKLAWLKQAGEKTTRGLGYVPGLSVLAGASGGADIVEALRRLEKGDYPGAAIKGVGGLGALTSLLPFPLTRLGGGALALMSMPAEALYQGAEPLPPAIDYSAP